MSEHPQHTTAAEDRVAWSQLIAYGMGGLVPVALFNIAGQLMGLLGNISLGLSAFWLGTIMIIPRLWEALSNPIIGHFSDNTRTRFGRRRPYVLVGGIAVALTFVAMWWVPRGDWIRAIFPSQDAYNWMQLVYIMVGLLAFFTACDVFDIPHGALGLEMSPDYHERTRLFSAKSFLGNLFAMGNGSLILLSSLEFFRGPGGNLTDGMRYVSLFIAAALVPLSFWWFFALKEPGFAIAKNQEKSSFFVNMSIALRNTVFLKLVAIIFVLAMGFNFVSIFSYYITIFYLYGGDANAAGGLLAINSAAWAVTALLAVFPLNWMSQRLGKNKTLLIAILLMCSAQLAKILCYNQALPYLVLIPTVLLSAGMLMFFTLGSSMVGDICDEDELNTGTRSEGTYYSVFWWFIKMGTAFASFVMGALLVFTSFDEKQNVTVDALSGNIAVMKIEAQLWLTQQTEEADRISSFARQIESMITNADKLRAHFVQRIEEHPDQTEHIKPLIEHVDSIRTAAQGLQSKGSSLVSAPADVISAANGLMQQMTELKKQAPKTLFRLRLVEIGLPLLLSIVSIVLTLGYPLTEERCYAIKEALKKRHAMPAT